MKYLITTIFGIILLIASILGVPFEEVEGAFTKGDAAKIMALGTPKILISINGVEGVYSKSQGTQVLDAFFKENPPKEFSFKFRGKEEGATSFAVGQYVSEESYRVSIKFKKTKSTHQIESLTINEGHKHRRGKQ